MSDELIEKNEELAKVKPSAYFIEIGGKKRQVRFANRALAEVQERYGSLNEDVMNRLSQDVQTKPMTLIPWLIQISIKDKEGLETVDDILDVLDDEGKSVFEVFKTISDAMTDSLSHMGGGRKGSKKK